MQGLHSTANACTLFTYLDVRGVDDIRINVSDDEVDLVGQPAHAEDAHHDHHHLDDLLGRRKRKSETRLYSLPRSRMRARDREKLTQLISALYSEEVQCSGIKTEIQLGKPSPPPSYIHCTRDAVSYVSPSLIRRNVMLVFKVHLALRDRTI